MYRISNSSNPRRREGRDCSLKHATSFLLPHSPTYTHETHKNPSLPPGSRHHWSGLSMGQILPIQRPSWDLEKTLIPPIRSSSVGALKIATGGFFSKNIWGVAMRSCDEGCRVHSTWTACLKSFRRVLRQARLAVTPIRRGGHP